MSVTSQNAILVQASCTCLLNKRTMNAAQNFLSQQNFSLRFRYIGLTLTLNEFFSLMQSQWTKERNKLHVESVKGILFVQHNFKHLSCRDFYTYLCSQPSDKYRPTWSQPVAQSSSSLTVPESQDEAGD